MKELPEKLSYNISYKGYKSNRVTEGTYKRAASKKGVEKQY
jgi:hypothetical protein